MSLLHRAAWTSAVAVLLGLAMIAFAQRGVVPAPRPAPPPAVRPGMGSGNFAGGRGGITPSLPPGGRPGMNTGPFPGRGFLGGNGTFTQPVQRTPATVLPQLRARVARDPAGVLRSLRGEDGRILQPADRQALAREAVGKLAVEAETSKKPVDALAQVRAVRAGPGELPAEVRTSLERLCGTLERRVLAEGLHEVAAQAERGQWGEVSQETQRRLTELNDPRLAKDPHLQSAEFRVRRQEVREVLGEMRDLAHRLDILERFGSALKTLPTAKPGDAARSLGRLDRASLPPELRSRLDLLQGLAEVKQWAAQKWTRPPDVAEVKASVARLERGLVDVEGADPRLGKVLLQELAVKAVLEGHTAEALKLLPEGGPAGHAARLLRDLKALALGEGKVETEPARAALAQPGPRIPPGVEPLVPEGGRDGWRPPVREKASADFPPLEKAEQVGTAARAGTEKTLAAQQARLHRRGEQSRQKVSAVYQRVMAPELAERRRLAAVEGALDRRLRPAERVQARALLAQGQPPAQVAAGLKGPPEDEEREFLADVERRLGGTSLGDEQRKQAASLRKAGRTAAEVADILRP